MELKRKKQAKLHVKRGDKVKVLAGDYKGNISEVLHIDMEKSRAIVQGVNILKKFVKPSAQQPNGGTVQIEGSIHISNLMVIDPATNRPRRTGRKRDANGKLQRYFKKHKRD